VEPCVLERNKLHDAVCLVLTNGARPLQTELSNREGYKTILVGWPAIPLSQDMKGSQGECSTSLTILPDPVPDFLEVADQRQPREHRDEKFTQSLQSSRT